MYRERGLLHVTGGGGSSALQGHRPNGHAHAAAAKRRGRVGNPAPAPLVRTRGARRRNKPHTGSLQNVMQWALGSRSQARFSAVGCLPSISQSWGMTGETKMGTPSPFRHPLVCAPPPHCATQRCVAVDWCGVQGGNPTNYGAQKPRQANSSTGQAAASAPGRRLDHRAHRPCREPVPPRASSQPGRARAYLHPPAGRRAEGSSPTPNTPRLPAWPCWPCWQGPAAWRVSVGGGARPPSSRARPLGAVGAPASPTPLSLKARPTSSYSASWH